MPTKLLRLEEATSRAEAGGKAEHLHWLYQQGERIPATLIVTAVDEGLVDRERLRRELSEHIDPHARYAIRSSADVEDGRDFSFAGQFTTHLDVGGLDSIVDAIEDVARSAASTRITAYLEKTGRTGDRISVAVLVQEMVAPLISGVSFSRNPVTGLDEVVVEAVRGPGTLLVDGGHTPDRWIHKWGDWVVAPESSDIPQDLIAEVVERTRQIAGAFGRPVDLEWVYDGSDLHWVQLRAITGIGDLNVYSNRIAREVLPGLIKPLVWSVNVPMVNRAWIRLFTELVGDIGLEPHDLARSFGYRAYFNMSAIGDIFAALGMPRDSLELLLGLPAGSDQPGFKPGRSTFRHLPRMVKSLATKTRLGRKVDSELPAIRARFEAIASLDVESLTDPELLDTINSLDQLGTEAAYLNIVTPLFANLYSAILRKALERHGIDFADIDLTGEVPAMQLWNPNAALDRLSARLRARPDDLIGAVTRDGWAGLPPDVVDEAEAFLDRFGHLSSSGNDFSVTPWRDDRDLVARLIASHDEGGTSRRPWNEVDGRLPRRTRLMVGALRRRAVDFIVRREAVSSTYTFGYGLFRRCFLECGRRLVARGLIDDAEDVMYLDRAEVEALLRRDGLDTDARSLAAERRHAMEAAKEARLPDIIYGEEYVVLPRPAASTGTLEGVATSRGRYRGKARVILNQDQFHELQAGEVLVIPYSDVGWTPLFGRAGAVVAESGGMLSHSSIVAREYGVPCVVSVSGATGIPTGATVTVDGYTGEVVIEE